MLDYTQMVNSLFLGVIKCNNMERSRENYQAWVFPFGMIVASAALFLTSLHSFALLQALTELFGIVIAFGIFTIAWSSRRYIDNIFLLLLGVSYFFVGALDLVHMLARGDLGISRSINDNLLAQLWIASQYLEAFSLAAALIFFQEKNINKFFAVRKKSHQIFLTYSVVFYIIVIAIFSGNVLPVLTEEGLGLTSFGVYGEYVALLIFLGSLGLLFKKRKMFNREMVNLLSIALIVKVFAELLLAEFLGTHNFFEVLGYLFHFIFSLLLYKAILEGGLMRPYEFLFADLKRSEDRYRSLVELSPDAIVVHSNGKILYANEPAKKLFGVEKIGELIDAELTDFFGADYRERIHLRIKNIFSGKWKQSPTMEMEVLHANGQIIPVEVKGMKIFYEGKEVIESIIRDVSKRKKAEERIQSLAKFPEEDPSPVIRALADGRVQYANRPAHKMLSHLGWLEGDVLPEPLLSSVQQVLKKKIKQEAEVTCVCGRIFSIVFAPGLTEDWVNLYGLEITERKKAEKELMETQAELRKKIEEQLMESYKHLGLVNRKISLLLELESHSHSKENKQEIVEYILSSLLSLSYAKTGLLYLAVGKNHFNLVSSVGLENKKNSKIQVVSEGSVAFIKELVSTGKRVSGSCELLNINFFNDGLDFSYFVALPIQTNGVCRGFLFLGFTDRKSMDVQELEFLDVFVKHVSTALSNAGILG
jgi:PAS domain S-box-containing protein